jgi:hypothetical protein
MGSLVPGQQVLGGPLPGGVKEGIDAELELSASWWLPRSAIAARLRRWLPA